jgi:hypothetical protein
LASGIPCLTSGASSRSASLSTDRSADKGSQPWRVGGRGGAAKPREAGLHSRRRRPAGVR